MPGRLEPRVPAVCIGHRTCKVRQNTTLPGAELLEKGKVVLYWDTKLKKHGSPNGCAIVTSFFRRPDRHYLGTAFCKARSTASRSTVGQSARPIGSTSVQFKGWL